MFERKNSRLLVWLLFIKGTMEQVCFKLRFRMACEPVQQKLILGPKCSE